MKVKITMNCYVEGVARKKGEIIDMKNPSLLIGCGKATTEFEEPKPKKRKAPVNRQIEDYQTR